MKKQIFQIPKDRGDVERLKNENYGWMVDFEPDSILNIQLRKTDIANFALNNEGNIYNHIINQVCQKIKTKF